jgi:hypothetical protein
MAVEDRIDSVFGRNPDISARSIPIAKIRIGQAEAGPIAHSGGFRRNRAIPTSVRISIFFSLEIWIEA